MNNRAVIRRRGAIIACECTSERCYAMARHGSILVAISLVLWVAAQAQDPAPPFDGGPAEDSSAAVVTNSRSATRLSRGQQIQRPIYLTGSVVLSSGEKPLEPVMIRRVCGSDSSPEGYTDAKGRFSFQVGSGTSTASFDASVGGQSSDDLITGQSTPFGRLTGVNPSMGVDLSGCSLVVDAPGYRSNPIRLSRMHSMDRTDVGTFILTPLGGSQATAVSATTLAAPKKAKSAFEKAMKEIRKGSAAKVERVINELTKAVELYPEYAAAWTLLGQTKIQIGDVSGAGQALQRALEIDPLYIKPYEPLIVLRMSQGDWRRANELADVALEFNSADVRMRWFKAVSQYELGSFDEAIRIIDAIQNDEQEAKLYPQTHHIRGLIHARRGEFDEAASEYRRYLEIAPESVAGDRIRRELNEWQELGVI